MLSSQGTVIQLALQAAFRLHVLANICSAEARILEVNLRSLHDETETEPEDDGAGLDLVLMLFLFVATVRSDGAMSALTG